MLRAKEMEIPKKMVDEYRLLQDALNTMRYAQSLKRLNQELYDQLCGSIVYLVKYCEKNNLTLPNKEALLGLVIKSHSYIDNIKEKQMPPLSPKSEHPSTTPKDSTEPKIMDRKLGDFLSKGSIFG
jgi:hypothetical protein